MLLSSRIYELEPKDVLLRCLMDLSSTIELLFFLLALCERDERKGGGEGRGGGVRVRGVEEELQLKLLHLFGGSRRWICGEPRGTP
jgi:hypothetical protein